MQVKNILFAAGIAALMAGCNSVDFKKTSSGIAYKVFPSKSGLKVATGDVVKFFFTMKAKDSVVNTNYNQFPGYQPCKPNPQGGYLDNAITEVLLNCKKGDSLFLSMNNDTIMARDPQMAQQLNLKKGEKFTFGLRVLDVFKTPDAAQADYMSSQKAYIDKQQKEQEQRLQNDPKVKAQMQKDDKMLNDYFAANKISPQKVGSGVYVQVTNPGTEPKIAKNKFVTLFYTGTTLAGATFDSNVGKEPATFEMSGRTIKGFEEGLMGLGKGAKAKIFIPSMLAYADRSPSPAIGAFENLVFDVQILEVSDTAPAQPAMPDPRQQPRQ
jgi:FKBP-type peptidyl-prolyl cis-trans isomerase FkpA